jgi:antirestriction protein
MTDITNMQDSIDGEELIARIAELEEDTERDAEDTEELISLKGLKTNIENVRDGDIEWGDIRLISDDSFTDYAEEEWYARGNMDRDSESAWYMDWEAVARDMKNRSFTFIDFDGIEFLMRDN